MMMIMMIMVMMMMMVMCTSFQMNIFLVSLCQSPGLLLLLVSAGLERGIKPDDDDNGSDDNDDDDDDDDDTVTVHLPTTASHVIV